MLIITLGLFQRDLFTMFINLTTFLLTLPGLDWKIWSR